MKKKKRKRKEPSLLCANNFGSFPNRRNLFSSTGGEGVEGGKRGEKEEGEKGEEGEEGEERGWRSSPFRSFFRSC